MACGMASGSRYAPTASSSPAFEVAHQYDPLPPRSNDEELPPSSLLDAMPPSWLWLLLSTGDTLVPLPWLV
jgi:hypothetical protein